VKFFGNTCYKRKVINIELSDDSSLIRSDRRYGLLRYPYEVPEIQVSLRGTQNADSAEVTR